MTAETPFDFTPRVLERVALNAGYVELVEWQYPDMIEFVRTEDDLMLEMSLPPYASEASACFPDIEPERRCYMGTLFIRWPGAKIGGRSEGGQIRVVRLVFSREAAQRILRHRPSPDISFLQSLLAIRNEALRNVMRLVHRELTNPIDRSIGALSALMDVAGIELERLCEREPDGQGTGRLAAWQYRRIRERLAEGAPIPTVTELAALCGISPRHLHRQFQALTGKTVADYIEATRIEQAKRLLAKADEPIKSIAQACGFAHGNSFARAFRRSTGLSPLAYRQRAGGGAADRVH